MMVEHPSRHRLAPPARVGRHLRTVGRRPTPLYHAWAGMIDRCTKPRHKSWPDFGGRGISVCGRWRDFDAFCDDVGPHPGKGLILYRPDVEGHYEPGNARWGTRAEANPLRRRA